MTLTKTRSKIFGEILTKHSALSAFIKADSAYDYSQECGRCQRYPMPNICQAGRC